MAESFLEVVGGKSQYQEGSPVIISTYRLHDIEHYKVRPADQPLKADYDEEPLPRYLFIGASLMTLAILRVLGWQLFDAIDLIMERRYVVDFADVYVDSVEEFVKAYGLRDVGAPESKPLSS